MSQDKKFYVYVHRYASGPKQGEVFYVGKGKGKRQFSMSGRSCFWKNIADKNGFTSEIVMRFDSEACAFSFERALIKYYGRRKLCNLTDGGEGPSGFKRSEEVNKIVSLKLSGKKRDKSISLKISKALTGRKLSDSHRISMAAQRKGRVVSENQRNDISIALSKSVLRSDGKLFKSMTIAAKETSIFTGSNCYPGRISEVCSGKRKTAYGFTWAYADDV
jgi:hypothetical protein